MLSFLTKSAEHNFSVTNLYSTKGTREIRRFFGCIENLEMLPLCKAYPRVVPAHVSFSMTEPTTFADKLKMLTEQNAERQLRLFQMYCVDKVACSKLDLDKRNVIIHALLQDPLGNKYIMRSKSISIAAVLLAILRLMYQLLSSVALDLINRRHTNHQRDLAHYNESHSAALIITSQFVATVIGIVVVAAYLEQRYHNFKFKNDTALIAWLHNVNTQFGFNKDENAHRPAPY